ncbi:MAG: Gfo/Idh/MocA family oxidoreductase [Phycicoccus sp.]|nr:Gfo/Idh/MocA family oxidoreductase [Phycicoccus sp.]
MTRVGIVGYGMAGRDIHRGPLQRAGCEIVAVVTANPERAAQARADLPGVAVHASVAEMLGAGGLDLVVIASSTAAHVDNAWAVVEAKIPVVVDKPLALNAEDAVDLVDRALHENVPLTVFQNRRYDPEFTTLAHVVRSGVLGEAFRFEHRWERWRPQPKDRWREQLTSDEGGGLLLDLHSHLVDAAVQLFGEVESVMATMASRSTVADDDTFLLCRHTSGVLSHLSTTSLAGAPGPRVRLLGTQAAFIVATIAPEAATFPDQADAPGATGWLYRGDEREPVPTVPSDQADFYTAVREALASPDPQAAMPVDPFDAVHVMAVLDAARISVRGERVVDVITPGRRPD